MTDNDADAGTASEPALARALGLSDAVVIGLGSMIGAGVFAAFAPAAEAAGAGLLIGLAIAAARPLLGRAHRGSDRRHAGPLLRAATRMTVAEPPPVTAASPTTADAWAGRAWLRAYIELAVLWTFAVALPLFQLLADSPDYLIADDNGWPDLPVVSVALVAVPPALPVLVEMLLRSRPRAAALVHRVCIAGLVAVFLIQAFKDHIAQEGMLPHVLALAGGAAIAYLYGKGRFLPSVLAVLAPVPLGVLVWFLAFSGASELAWPHSDDPAGPRAHLSVPVVVVVFDELSAASLTDRGRVNPRFPAFAGLARTSTWFPNATTVADNTLRAVPAIFTGRLVPKGRLPIAWQHPPSVFDRVDGARVVHEPITRLCMGGCDDRSWMGHGVDLVRNLTKLMRERLGRHAVPRGAGLPIVTIDARPEQVRGFARDAGSGLNVLHVELPHVPYQYRADGTPYPTTTLPPGVSGEQWTTDASVVHAGEARYLAQLRYTDSLLGDLVAELRRKRLWDRALVIVTADHGVAFVPGQSRRNVSVPNFGEIAGVPLFVKRPGQVTGRVSRAGVKTIDILPTIGEEIGARWRLPGHALQHPVSRPETAVSAQFGTTVKMPLPYYEVLRDRASALFARTAAEPPPKPLGR